MSYSLIPSENEDDNLGEAVPIPVPAGRSAKVAATLSKNIGLSLARVVVNALVGLVLPGYLTHHLPVTTYGAWVLILQLGAFVSYLDIGVQTGVAKFVAEHEARGNETEAGRYASAGLAIMTLSGLVGLLLTLFLAWQVPRFFHNMPAGLYQDVRSSVVLVGGSLSFGLVCSVFSAIFLGLQRYAIPMSIAIANRVLFTIAVLVSVFCHSSLAAMGAAAALVNVATGLLQAVAWRKMASRIRVSFALVDSKAFRQMMRYCSVLAVWMAGMVCVSGLDVTIVGHFAYNDIAYYSVAALPANFMIMVISSLLGPVMPASSALSTQRSASQMGDILVRATRYSTLLLLLTGLPLIVYGLPILRLWVGPVYAYHSLTYLRILVIANIIRNFCAPYATLVAATGKLRSATAAPVLEAVVNLCSSLYLASRFGAIGVAYGTLIGSFVSVVLHFAVSMHYTRQTLAISRVRLFTRSLLRSAMVIVPTCIILLWKSASEFFSEVSIAIIWCVSTMLFAWFGSLDEIERTRLKNFIKNRLMLVASHDAN